MNEENEGGSGLGTFMLWVGIVGVIGFVLTCILAVPE